MWGDGLGRMSRRRAREGHGARVGSTLLSGGDGGKSGQALAWGIESRRRRGRTAVIDQGRWRRVRGMGSLRGSVWVRDFGQIPEGIEDPPLWACGQRGWSAFPGRPPAGLQARLSGRAAEEDDLPFRAGCRRGLLLAYPVRWPKAGWLATQGRLPESGYSPSRSGHRKG